MSEHTPFEQALLDSLLEFYADIPENEDEIDVTFSPEFEAAGEKLIRSTQRKTWRYVNTAAKRVALVAILAALLATTAMAIPAVREAVIDFFLHDKEDHYSVTFDPEAAANAPDCIQEVYLPTYLPEGFTLYDEILISTAGVNAVWINREEHTIWFTQDPIPENPENGDWYGVNSEGVTQKQLLLGDQAVVCIYDEGSRIYLWTDNRYFYNLICPPEVSDEEMERIFYSIQVQEDVVIN